MTITNDDKLILTRLMCKLEAIALRVGPMHSAWNVIFDIRANIKGSPAVITDIHELIEIAEGIINEHMPSA